MTQSVKNYLVPWGKSSVQMASSRTSGTSSDCTFDFFPPKIPSANQECRNAFMIQYYVIIMLIQLMNAYYVIFTLKSFFPPMGPASASCSLNWALVVLKRRLLGSFSNCCAKRAANGLQANLAVAEDISHSNVAKCCAPKSGRMAWGPGCWMPKGRKNILRAACFVLLTTCCCDVVMIQMVTWYGDIYTVPRMNVLLFFSVDSAQP